MSEEIDWGVVASAPNLEVWEEFASKAPCYEAIKVFHADQCNCDRPDCLQYRVQFLSGGHPEVAELLLTKPNAYAMISVAVKDSMSELVQENPDMHFLEVVNTMRETLRSQDVETILSKLS